MENGRMISVTREPSLRQFTQAARAMVLVLTTV
jgi:hypothetical protein